jgi:hypothetical protein
MAKKSSFKEKEPAPEKKMNFISFGAPAIIKPKALIDNATVKEQEQESSTVKSISKKESTYYGAS